MRRRNLFESVSGVLTLSANSGTANAANNSYVTFTVAWNDVALTDENVVVTSNQSWATPTWSASSSKVRVNCSANNDVSNNRSATIAVTYKGISATYALTQSHATWEISPSSQNGCPIDDRNNFICVKVNNSTVSPNDYTITSYPSWVTPSKVSNGYNLLTTTNEGSSTRSGYVYITYGGSTQDTYLTQLPTSRLCDVRFDDGNIYSYDQWPTNGVPIGVVIPGQTKCVSVKYVSPTNPDTGSASGVSLYWGGNNYSVSGTNSYDGKANTAAILSVDNSYSTSWQTASTISNVSNNQYIHPMAQCCWRYHTASTNQGDWYMPSNNEIKTLCDKKEIIACTIMALRSKYTSAGVRIDYASSGAYYSSTHYNATQVYYYSMYDCTRSNLSKTSSNSCVPFLQL